LLLLATLIIMFYIYIYIYSTSNLSLLTAYSFLHATSVLL